MLKQKTGRVFALVLAVVMLVMAFPGVAGAAPTTVRRENTVSGYIEVFNGSWNSMEVREYRTAEGNVAYCIQHNVTGPGTGGNAYGDMNPSEQLSDYQLKGIYAILLHGYPNSNGGMSDEAGRYVTGLAIRCWLTETGDPNHTYYSYLDRVNYPERMRSTGGNTVGWLDELLGYARAQDIMQPSLNASGMTFARSASEPNYYVGSTTITGSNVTNWTCDFSGLPAGTIVDGNTGTMGQTVTIKVPVAASGSSFTLSFDGYSNRTTASVHFLKSGGLQNIVVDAPGFNTLVANASISPRLPQGNVNIIKRDSSNNNGVAGAVFNVRFAGANQGFTHQGNGVYTFGGGTYDLVTPASGQISVQNLPAGAYQLVEVTPPSGFVGAADQNVTITDGGTATNTFLNTPTEVVIEKTDKSTGGAVPGSTIRLYEADGVTQVGDYVTGADGKITVKYLPFGTYKWQEITAPDGYTVDPTMYTFTIAPNGAVTGTVVFQDDITQFMFTKTDAKTGDVLDGLEFKIKDKATDQYMTFTFDSARNAYVPDPIGAEEITTDQGIATVERLAKNVYILEEVEPFASYVQTEPIEFELTDDTNTTTPLMIEMENEPTRLVFEKKNAVTKEIIDGCVFRVIVVDVDGITEGEYMPLAWDDVTETYNYDPDGSEMDFTTKEGKAVIDYLPKGSYEIEETEYDEQQYLPPQTLPFELDETTSYLNPLDVLFKNWQGYGTLRVYHRRVVTKEHLADPYYLTRPLDESFDINPDAMVLRDLPIRFVEVYRTPRHLEMDKFAPEVAATLDPLSDETLLHVDPDYKLPSQQAFTDEVTADAQDRDIKDAWIDSTEFNIKGDYDNQITTIVYWYEDIATPLTESGEPAVNDKIEVDGTPKTGDETNIVFPVAVAVAAGLVICGVFIARKRKQRKETKEQ